MGYVKELLKGSITGCMGHWMDGLLAEGRMSCSASWYSRLFGTQLAHYWLTSVLLAVGCMIMPQTRKGKVIPVFL
jgi:hypothetical protein